MVLGIIWLYWIGSVLALVLGYVALNQFKMATVRGEQPQTGRGMALAGVVLGWVGLASLALILIGILVASKPNGHFQ